MLLASVVLCLCALFWVGSGGDAVRAQQGLPGGQGYAGSAACAQCHPAIHKAHAQTAMRAALLLPGDPRALAGKAPIRDVVGPGAYEVERRGEGYDYRVRFGGEEFRAPVRWAFGLGAAGQTYILEHDGALLESRVSFYDEIGGLDLTIGAANEQPTTLVDAAGRKMSEADVRECFGCHALGVPQRGEPVLTGIEPGVGCESCHGPAARHVAARIAGDMKSGVMRSLKNQEAEEISQLCGGCHRTWEDVVSMRIRGVNNVRFQPYRLTLSACYDSGDTRISCVACHNSHENVSREASSYDAKCLACHAGTAAGSGDARAACKAGERAMCSSCHMPKRPLPGAHRAFTDHYIRVHRANEPYPDL